MFLRVSFPGNLYLKSISLLTTRSLQVSLPKHKLRESILMELATGREQQQYKLDRLMANHEHFF